MLFLWVYFSLVRDERMATQDKLLDYLEDQLEFLTEDLSLVYEKHREARLT